MAAWCQQLVGLILGVLVPPAVSGVLQEVAKHMVMAVDAPNIGSIPACLAAAVALSSSVWMFARSEWACLQPHNCTNVLRSIFLHAFRELEPVLLVLSDMQVCKEGDLETLGTRVHRVRWCDNLAAAAKSR